MHHLIRKILKRNRTVGSKTSHVRYIQTVTFINSGSKPRGQQSLTVSYLVNSRGLSIERAIAASKVVKIENTEKPNSLLELLTTYGFTKAHISTLISKHPLLILAHSEITIRPKLEYFQSLGIRGSDLPSFICSDTSILLSSLEKRIIPTCDLLNGNSWDRGETCLCGEAPEQCGSMEH